MKRLLMTFCCAFLCVNLMACASSQNSNILTAFEDVKISTSQVYASSNKNTNVETSTVNALMSRYPDNLDDLEKYSDYIVKGKIQEGSKSELIYADGSDDVVMSFTTVTPLEINQVYKGDLEVGQIVEICEKYYKSEIDGKIHIRHFGDYMPSTVDGEYIFFLNKCKEGTKWEGKYSVSYFERSRYPVFPKTRSALSVDELDNSDLNLDTGDATIYKELLKEVMDKYY